MNRSSFSGSGESLHECREVVRLLGAYLDGELDAAQTLEIEEHVSGCESCRERAILDRATRGSLKKAVKTGAPDGMRARMAAAMMAEQPRVRRAGEIGRSRRLGTREHRHVGSADGGRGAGARVGLGLANARGT